MMAVVLVIRFLLELCALAALGYWGFHVGDSLATRLVLGLGAPTFAAVVWGAFVSPKARVALPPATRLAVELLVFATATLALAASGEQTLAVAFAVAAVVDGILVRVLEDPSVAE